MQSSYQNSSVSSTASSACKADSMHLTAPLLYTQNHSTPPPENGAKIVRDIDEIGPYFLIQGNKSSTRTISITCDDVTPPTSSDHDERLDKYARAHKRAISMSGWIAENQPNDKHLSTLLRECGDYLIFRNYYTVNEVRLHGMSSCKKHILCPLCAIRRGAKSVKAYLDRLEVIKASYPKIKAFLVTFTVKNGDSLHERFNHLQKSMKNYNLRRSRANGFGRHLPVEANKALGAVWSYEFKRGEGSGLWHPHAHAVWLCYDTPDQNQLSKEWLDITGDSHIVNVTPFHNQDDVVSGFLEVFKYAVKFSDMPLEQNWEGYKYLNGRRLVASFGLFRGVQIPESNTDEPLESLPYIELFYRYLPGGKYKLESSKEVIGVPF